MPRYRIELRGKHDDLQRLHHGFPSGDVYVIEDGSQFHLVGERFDGEEDTHRVYQLACEHLHELSCAACLRSQVMVGAVEFVAADGQPRRTAYLSATGFSSSSGFSTARLLVNGVEQPSLTRSQRRLDVMRHNQHLRIVLEIWHQRERSWSQLYRIWEEIAHVANAVSLGWCSRAESDRFTQTANSAQAAGIDARHAEKGWLPPKQPVTLAEAEAFIERLMDLAFDYEADRAR